nr:septum formation initiator family protein [Methylocapsa acidiphila]
MVTRRRVRAVLYPLCLYCVSGAVAGYFIWHAVNGERGLKTKDQYEQRIAQLREELRGLQQERSVWSRKIALMRGQTIDRDILEDEVRSLLGRVDRNDLVIMLPSRPQAH